MTSGVERLRAAAGDPRLGIETPRLDAELLLAHAIGVDRTTVVAHPEAPVGPAAAEAFHAAIARRAAGEPVAYLRGIKEFHGLAFAVDRRALIPRPETERLVELALADILRRLAPGGRPTGRPVTVVDVGTGSGAVAVALAVAVRSRRVAAEAVAITAVDASSDALDLARENAVGHGVGDRIRFVGADLLPPSGAGPWDVVVANLPYVRSDAMATLPTPTSFEPPLALDGGPDGMTVIDRLLDLLPGALANGGIAFLEIGGDQGDLAAAHVAARLPGWRCHVAADLAGLPRVAIVEREVSA